MIIYFQLKSACRRNQVKHIQVFKSIKIKEAPWWTKLKFERMYTCTQAQANLLDVKVNYCVINECVWS